MLLLLLLLQAMQSASLHQLSVFIGIRDAAATLAKWRCVLL